MRFFFDRSRTFCLRQKSLALWVLAGVALAGTNTASGQGSTQGKDDHVVFSLAIPDNAKFIETRTLQKTFDWGDGSPTEVTKMSQKSEIIFRTQPSGFAVSVKPRLDRQSQPTPESPAAGVASALRGLSLRFEFDANGNLRRLHGLEKAMEELASAVPAEFKPMLDTLLPRVLEEIKDEWGSRYANLAGQRFRVGYRQSGEAPLTLMQGVPPVSAKVARGVMGRQKCDGRDCVVFFMGYTVEKADGYGESVTRMLGDWLKQMFQGLGVSGSDPKLRKMMAEMPRLKVQEIVAVTRRLVDPQTMIVYKEERTKGFKARADTKEVTWMEITNFNYERAN